MAIRHFVQVSGGNPATETGYVLKAPYMSTTSELGNPFVYIGGNGIEILEVVFEDADNCEAFYSNAIDCWACPDILTGNMPSETIYFCDGSQSIKVMLSDVEPSSTQIVTYGLFTDENKDEAIPLAIHPTGLFVPETINIKRRRPAKKYGFII